MTIKSSRVLRAFCISAISAVSLAAPAASAATISSSGPASHRGSVISEKAAIDVRASKTFLVSHGTSPVVADKLVQNLKAGKRLQSDGGFKPKFVTTTKTGSTITRVNHFADGSVSVYETPNLAALSDGSKGKTMRAASVSGCQVSETHYSATYTGCVTRASNSHVTLAYRFNYATASGVAPKITRTYTPEAQAFLGNFSGGAFEPIDNRHARYSGTYTVYLGVYSTTCYLQVNLVHDSTAEDDLQC